jgi:glucosylceramidase
MTRMRLANLCCLAAAGLAAFFLVPSTARAAGPAVNVWLTTTDGANQLALQPSLAFRPDTTAVDGTAIDVDERQLLQQIDGFGAAVTDSSAFLIGTKMSTAQRSALMTKLFDPGSGIGTSFVRIPMGASDFSVNGPYSYDDVPAGQSDPSLAQFSIGHDTAYILPVLQQAHATNPAAKFMANPWSPPAWMKSNGSMIGVVNGQVGTLKASAFGPLAQYFVKFIQAYQAQGIPIYAITPQNEPLFAPSNYPGMSMPASDEMSFIKNNLSPAMAQANLHPKIIPYDHNWDNIGYAQTLLADPTTFSDIAGTSWHCYGGSPKTMTTIHFQFPTREVYETECSTGAAVAPINTIDLLMQSVQNWARTVELWNIALDPNHGPHTGGCPDCLGVVTIDPATGNVTFPLDYFLLGHFSKFVTPGAFHISSSTLGSLADVAFKNPDGSKVVVVHNGGGGGATFKVRWNATQSFVSTLPAGATATFKWSGSPLPGTYAISAGGGAAGAFSADGFFAGGTAASSSAPVSTAGVVNPAPQSVYQHERFGNFTYTLPNLVVGATYTVRLHFNEFFWTQSGQRVFNVAINGSQVLSRFDIIAQTGGQNRATVREFSATADANGQIAVQFTTIVDNAKVSGIEIIPKSYAVNAGGGPAGAFLGDRFFSGGTPASSGAAVGTSGVTNPAPQAVYQSERFGSFSFGATGLQPGRTYTLRLHFNEFFWTQPGQRIFDVAINGTTVLSRFDIIAQTGGQNRAAVREFSVAADGNGEIAVQFVTIVDNAKVSGIEVNS